MKSRPHATLACLLVAAPGLALAQAQATVKPDGQFRYALGAGASYSSGNTQSSTINISGDGVRADQDSKWQFGGKGLYGHSEGVKTAENLVLGTQYDRDIDPLWFGFAKADALRDKLANISARASLFGGVGRHVINSDTLTFDITAGLGYTQDRYVTETEVNDQLRTRYGRAERCSPKSPTTSGRRRPRFIRSSRSSRP